MQQTDCTVRYREISRALGEQIRTGTYAPGEQLPTEKELSVRFAVNRHTVREAIRQLRNDGLVYGIRGKGNFVTTDKIIYPLSRKVRFTQNILAAELTPGARLIDMRQSPAQDRLAEKLALPAGAGVIRLDILRTVNDLPFSLATSWLPAERFPGLTERLQGSFSLYAILQHHYQVDPVRRESLIEVGLPGSREMQYLQIGERHPLLLIHSLACDQQGIPVEFVATRTRGDLGCLTVDFSAPDAPGAES